MRTKNTLEPEHSSSNHITLLFLVAIAFITVIASTSSIAYSATDGKWVLTGTNTYTPAQYTSRQNSYYKYNDSYQGITSDGFVQFLASGGYTGPGDSFTADMYHECSQPAKSYAPGELVTLTLRTRATRVVNNYKGGHGEAYICKEDKTWPNDGRSRFYKNNIANFQTSTGSFAIATIGMTVNASAAMPKSAEYGERVAIIFVTTSSSDGINQSYESHYGGHQIYEWIYTFQKTSVAKPVKGVISSIKNVKGAKAKVTIKKVNSVTQYQIRYKVAGAKKWTKKSSQNNTFTISVKKGKKVTVQARLKNSSGWGKWGTKKSLTTDKK